MASDHKVSTLFLLLAQYGATAVIPVNAVCRDFFAPLTLPNFIRKVSAGEIPLPIIRIERSQKTAKGVHIQDLANYIDERRAAAQKEWERLRSRGVTVLDRD